jgi:hypothetical protein
MAIRIKCDLEGFEKNWIDFRETSWPFGDRRSMLEDNSDIKALTVILGYVESWSLVNVSNKAVTFDPDGNIDLLNDVDDTLVGWLISAWFEARGQREDLPKKVS